MAMLDMSTIGAGFFMHILLVLPSFDRHLPPKSKMGRNASRLKAIGTQVITSRRRSLQQALEGTVSHRAPSGSGSCCFMQNFSNGPPWSAGNLQQKAQARFHQKERGSTGTTFRAVKFLRGVFWATFREMDPW